MATLAPKFLLVVGVATASLSKAKSWPITLKSVVVSFTNTPVLSFKYSPVSPVIRPVFIVVLATLKLVSPVCATRISSALITRLLKPAICVLPESVLVSVASLPSSLNVAALICKSLPDTSVGDLNAALEVFLRVKVFAVITLGAASASALEISPSAKLPEMPAALMVNSKFLFPKLTEPNRSTLL